jgi:hypothetical protein
MATAAKSTPTKKLATARKAAPAKKGQSRLAQADVPAYTLAEAMRVPEALRDDYAKGPASPLDIAKSLDMTPTSGPFRMLTGAAVAYGLTDSGAQTSSMIGLTPLGQRAVAPLAEGDDIAAMREALLKPRVIKEYLEKYDGNALPQPNIALNVIESLGVPQGVAERAYAMIMQNAESLGLLVDLKGKKYVKLDAPAKAMTAEATTEDDPEEEQTPGLGKNGEGGSYSVAEAPVIPPKPPTDPVTNNRVFITHGKNKEVVEQIKKILAYGKFEPIVSAQRETVSVPVPEKVLTDMRGCSAAIVHVGVEKVLLDEAGTEHAQINPNVLIEIGAAMALYPKRFVLLVEKGVKLPSNLQGLYEVRYEGAQLEFDATMKLLEVFSTF